MQFSNFSLKDDYIALDAEGFQWNLHDYADFEGFDYSTTITGSTLTLKWHLGKRIIKWRDDGCQHGVPNYPANGFILVFSSVDYLKITPRDVEMPKGEDLGVSLVSRVEADRENLPFHLLFQFNSGQTTRIGAEKAEFV